MNTEFKLNDKPTAVSTKEIKMEESSNKMITAVSFIQDKERSNHILWVTITDEDDESQVVEMISPNPIENSYHILGTTKLVSDVLTKSDLGKIRVTYTSGESEFEFWCESVEPIEKVDLNDHFTSKYA